MTEKVRAPRNQTLDISALNMEFLRNNSITLSSRTSPEELKNKIINQDLFECIDKLPDSFVDLMIIDPPYNLDKVYAGKKFSKTDDESYSLWVDSWMSRLIRLLKPNATVYICCDWQSSHIIQSVASKYLQIRNRITWEREKGRGAKSNWKNCSEDIWYCTLGKDYFFDVEAVKLMKRVIAPYRDESGKPKDWDEKSEGKYRLTHPSNLWTDISIPFWSMPENTDHPTQKPEKLIAKLIVASSKEGDMIFDPFMGSGTTCVTAKKLKRNYLGIEISEEYCKMAAARLIRANEDKRIQGYSEGVFWERNSGIEQKNFMLKAVIQKEGGLFNE